MEHEDVQTGYTYLYLPPVRKEYRNLGTLVDAEVIGKTKTRVQIRFRNIFGEKLVRSVKADNLLDMGYNEE